MEHDEDLGIDPADVDRIRHIMAEIDDAELELLDPPPGVWEGIAASVASIEARRPPAGATPAGQLAVEYAIDERDVLVQVGAGWAAFADDNWAPELAAPPTDRSLWSFIDAGPTAELWKMVVQRVRTEQRTLRVPFRCDAPGTRRWFEMTVVPGADGRVEFRSELVFEESRPPVDLLDPDVDRDADAVPVALCSWCGRGQHGTQWLDVEALLRVGRLLERASLPPVSYGICAACREEMAAELAVTGNTGTPV